MKNSYYFPYDQEQLMHGDAHYPGSQEAVDEVMQIIAHGGTDRDGTTQEQWLESLREFGVLDRIAIIIAKEYYNDAFSRFHKMMEDDIKGALGD